MKPRFTTGEMARLHGISKQTLIFYDKAGVFSPDTKDARNGYRYYSADQLEMLDHILILKDMGMSLQEIRDFLALPDTKHALTVMRHQQEVLKAQQRRIKAALERLNWKVETLEKTRAKAGEVRIEQLDTAWLITQPVTPPGEAVETDVALKQLLRRAQETQAPYYYQMGTRISPQSFMLGRYTQAFQVFFPLMKALPDKLCQRKPAGMYACCTHVGPYEEVGRTYEKLLQAIAQRRYEILDGSYEYCILDSLTARSTKEYVTEIQVPLGGFAP